MELRLGSPVRECVLVELYRRNLVRPEIVTFDKLYERARFIVEAEHKNDASAAA